MDMGYQKVLYKGGKIVQRRKNCTNEANSRNDGKICEIIVIISSIHANDYKQYLHENDTFWHD